MCNCHEPRLRMFSEHKVNNFDVHYKIVCIDIDEMCQGEDPFGYGIRADGKILTGARADEWLERDVMEE